MSLKSEGRMAVRFVIEGDHPALPGHFPGEPVVPGVVLLDRLLEAAEASWGSPLRVVGLPQVKFLAPLLPGEEAEAALEFPQPDGQPDSSVTALRFRVERGGQLIAQGSFQIASEGTH